MLRRALRASLDGLDRFWARACAPGSLQTSHLVVALFHVVHRTRSDANTAALAPNQEITVDDLRRFLDSMLRAGYSVVSSDDLAQHRQDDGKLLVLTFDDGYYNNTWALPVLEEFHAPASFFISTAHVMSGLSFWWDVVARQLAARGKSRREIDRALKALKAEPVCELEERLLADFGQAALMPTGDADRPFSPDELRDFAKSRWVTLGNHTSRHAILTRCASNERAREIAQGREELNAMTGVNCRAIAYPNGDYSTAVVEAARTCGHDVGFTCVPKANAIPRDERSLLTLGRHLVWGGVDYDDLVPQFAAPYLPGARIRDAIRQFS